MVKITKVTHDDGKLIETEANQFLLDSILVFLNLAVVNKGLGVGQPTSIAHIQAWCYTCGIWVGQPDLREAMAYLVEKKLINVDGPAVTPKSAVN